MTLPVPNLQAALVDKLGKLIPPWNSWFQQFSQNAPLSVPLTGTSPLSYEARSQGNIIIIGGTISIINLNRGPQNYNLTGQKIVPVSIGDVITITYSVAPAVNFLGA